MRKAFLCCTVVRDTIETAGITLDIRPFCTLYHRDLPQALEDRGESGRTATWPDTSLTKPASAYCDGSQAEGEARAETQKRDITRSGTKGIPSCVMSNLHPGIGRRR